MPRSTQFAGIAACLGLLLTSCTDNDDDRAPARLTASPSSSMPDSALTLIADADPAAAAISTSRALYDSSDVVVLAGPQDPLAITLGASTAVALGVPLLLSMPTNPSNTTSAPGSQPSQSPATGVVDLLGAEFDRLGVSVVLAVGTEAAQHVPAVSDADAIPVAAEPSAIGEVIGVAFGVTEPVSSDGLPAAFAALDPSEPVALLPAGVAPSEAGAQAGSDNVRFPEVKRPDAVTGTVLLATSSPEALPGIATARAAGVPVQVVAPEQLDPRSSSDAIATLSDLKPRAVIALGTGYASQQGLDWKLQTAATGALLPGGGQVLFPQRMFVALYGYTEGSALGVLGEQDANGAVQRAIETAGQYNDLVPTPVVPMFEIIATVASEFPGLDGNYTAEADVAQLQPWVDAAGAAGIYVVLDLQPGRTDFLTQAQLYEPLLRLPHVGLALDPEWRLKPDEVHLRQIGSVGIGEVNAVVAWLADLTQVNGLPQKLLVLHQFVTDMIQNRELLDTSREELAVLIHVDGYGAPGDKQATWQTIRADAPANVYWGWKNFIDEDLPLLTPSQTIAQAVPTPELITYQ